MVQVVNGGDEAPVGAALERAKQLVPVIYERRMRGLYVDNPDGKSLYTPADITEADARELVGYLIAAVAVLSPMPSDEAPARLLMELAAEHPGSFREAAALGLELAQVASDRAAEHVRAMFRGEVPGATGEEPIAR